ncbi:MAG: DbpA RNA binding domain-containing protein [Spirochaetes bacterium]|nr:DbpA RNA binding domain-containing protein [Spirochaetota bacterium]MBU1081263.1 DbpA RNA binding domain-containing protein [Spirochaetota bacterium]
MPSHSILPDSRRAAIEAAFDEALAEVRAAKDVALLQECRAIFRKRVPLHLRAYVAATLALKGAPRSSDRRGRSGPDARPSGESRAGGDKRKDGRQQQAPKNADKQKKEPLAREERKDREPAESREPREARENRYRGEGVTLFVSAGRRQRFYARVAVKVMLEIPGVADESVGDIRTMDNYSFIVVDPAIEDLVIAGLNGYDFKGRTLAVNRARKRGEPAPLADADAPASEGYSGEDYRDSGSDDSDGLDAFGSGAEEDSPLYDDADGSEADGSEGDVPEGDVPADDELEKSPEREDQ